jgi:heterodisulfide reductase subunit A
MPICWYSIAAVRPQPDADEFAAGLKIPLTQKKFVMEAHMKLRPLDLVNEGVYICGWPILPKHWRIYRPGPGCVFQSNDGIIAAVPHGGGIVSVVNEDQCVTCLTCVRSCPYGVPKVTAKGKAHIEAAGCQGCGICASVCPRKAITLQNYSDKQIMAQVDALKV